MSTPVPPVSEAVKEPPTGCRIVDQFHVLVEEGFPGVLVDDEAGRRRSGVHGSQFGEGCASCVGPDDDD
ncbi:hypothetical protein [Propionibacterium sp.]|uniref:hypothetical protein n=1 Tax=Propionibacterium sp. TaxID=1977903 RepID=UPI0039E7C072